LQERSEELWCEDPVAGVELARLAVQISGFLDESHYGKGLAEDTRALAWACLGNAYRVASDLRRAEEALDQAEAHLEHSGGEAYTEAQILSFRASLRSSQGQFREAAKLLDRALGIYREAKDRPLQGKTLIKKAAALAYDGKLQRAVRLARRGLSLIDPLEEPRLLVTAQHNLIGYLNEAGSPDQALDTLRKTRHLYQDLGEPSHLARLSWLEGRIMRDLGRLDEAEAALKEARDFFVQRGIGLDTARVLLDLATVYAQRGTPPSSNGWRRRWCRSSRRGTSIRRLWPRWRSSRGPPRPSRSTADCSKELRRRSAAAPVRPAAYREGPGVTPDPWDFW
jgi:tetratricopeptide (TPR) repeat protein